MVVIVDLDVDGCGEILVSKVLSCSGVIFQFFGGNFFYGIGGMIFGMFYIYWSLVILVVLDFWFLVQQMIELGSFLVMVFDGFGGNCKFGEEIFGGFDYDGDGCVDLFIGDIIGNGLNGFFLGFGYIVFDVW